MNKKKLKKLLTSFSIRDILDEFSPKNTDENKYNEDLPCRLQKTFPILYENKTEMQPWIYSFIFEVSNILLMTAVA